MTRSREPASTTPDRSSAVRGDAAVVLADLAVVAGAAVAAAGQVVDRGRCATRGSPTATAAAAGSSRGKWNTCCWVTRSGGSAHDGRPSSGSTQAPAATTTVPPRTVDAVGEPHHAGSATPRRAGVSMPHVRAGGRGQREQRRRPPAPASIVPACGWNTTSPSKRMPGHRALASRGRQHLVRHAGGREVAGDGGHVAPRAEVEAAVACAAGVVRTPLDLAPQLERAPGERDVERVAVGAAHDAGRCRAS